MEMIDKGGLQLSVNIEEFAVAKSVILQMIDRGND